MEQGSKVNKRVEKRFDTVALAMERPKLYRLRPVTENDEYEVTENDEYEDDEYEEGRFTERQKALILRSLSLAGKR